ncbi:MAG TPA: OmcA/MtrC family decaheme c-type cytochrome [Kofleriaceae bacterium]|nr:OmcA/MtrC family decaheme c-type cytochrome [Kofleriaceae bacterium]
MRRIFISLLILASACGGDDDETKPPGSWAVGPGVDVAVTGLEVDGDTARVAFDVKDAEGTPLDISGQLTDGAVDVSFVLAQLAENPDGSPGQYTAFTTRTVQKQSPTPDSSITAVQATTESVTAGTLDVVDVQQGSYRYTFAAPLEGLDPGLTQSVLAVAVREIDETESIDRDLFSVRPAGGDPIPREEVTDQTCNSCHGTFAAHGGRYTSPTQCVLCHTPQTTDPDTGNTVDFRVMIHKIHAGEELPSHQADPSNNYTIIGYMGSIHSWGNVAFPGPAENGTNVARCETCHAGAQGNVWQTRPSIAACTSCHDTTVFTANANPPFTVPHQGGVDPNLVNESTCIVCHGATSGVAPITATHYRGVFSPSFPTLELAIDSITNTGPGELPTITFRALVNGFPRNLLLEPLTNLAVTIAGPTTDIAGYWQARIQGNGAVGTLMAVDPAAGVFSYTLPAAGCTDAANPARTCAIPREARGTFEVGLEGYIQNSPAEPRAAAYPPVVPFAVTDEVAMPRRVIVTTEKCNGCHLDLSAHGGSRKNANYCVFCHNPNKAGETRIAHLENAGILAPSVDLRVMIHKIHMGEELTQPYELGGFPPPSPMNPMGSPINFGETRYPRARTDCEACHVDRTWTLPMDRSPAYLPSTALQMRCNEAPGADPDNYCTPANFVVAQRIEIAPQTSVCTSCHDQPDTFAHAIVNTTAQGVEACATCHGEGMAWDVAKFHGSP